MDRHARPEYSGNCATRVSTQFFEKASLDGLMNTYYIRNYLMYLHTLMYIIALDITDPLAGKDILHLLSVLASCIRKCKSSRTGQSGYKTITWAANMMDRNCFLFVVSTNYQFLRMSQVGCCSDFLNWY